MAEQGGLGGEPGAHPPPSLPDMLLHAEWASHACHRQLPLARPVGARLCLAFRNSAPCRRALVLQERYVLSSVRPRQVSFLVPTPPCLTLPRLVGWGGPASNGWRCPSAVGSFRPRSRCTSTRGSGQLPYLLTLSLEQSLWTICRPDTRRCPEQASWFLKHGVSPFCHSVTYLTRPASGGPLGDESRWLCHQQGQPHSTATMLPPFRTVCFPDEADTPLTISLVIRKNVSQILGLSSSQSPMFSASPSLTTIQSGEQTRE